MAQDGAGAVLDPKKFAHNSEQFPIFYYDGKIRIYKNPSNEIFVEDLDSRVSMRISQYPDGRRGLRFTTDHLVEPTVMNGMIGWRVSRR